MAFGGYEVTRSNIYNANKRDVSGVWWNKNEALSAVNIFKRENNVGDVIVVFEEDTEYDSSIVLSLFNDPSDGWIKEQISEW